MYAQLGDVAFDLPTYLDGYGGKRTYEYAEHKVIEGKPKLQWTGDGLEELTLDVVLHASYCNPEDQLNTLRDAAASHKAQPLVLGSGVYRGRYVITDIAETTRHTDPQGRAIHLETKVTLKEYVGDESLQAGNAVVAAGEPIPGAVKVDQAAAAVAEGLSDAEAQAAETLCQDMDLAHLDWPGALDCLTKTGELGGWSPSQTLSRLGSLAGDACALGVTGLTGLSQLGAAAILAVDCARDPATGMANLAGYLRGLPQSNLVTTYAAKLGQAVADPLLALARSRSGDLFGATGMLLRSFTQNDSSLASAWLPPSAAGFGRALMNCLPVYDRLSFRIQAFSGRYGAVPRALFVQPVSWGWVGDMTRYPA